jgi:hypothetical protein
MPSWNTLGRSIPFKRAGARSVKEFRLDPISSASNRDRFPKDFVFQLTRPESELLRRQFGILKTRFTVSAARTAYEFSR